jgi:hypothetical protein
MTRWLLLCVLFQAFLVSGAFARLQQGADVHRVQICSASGLQWVDLADSAPASGAPAAHHDHCALCGCLAVDLPTAVPGFVASTEPRSVFITERPRIGHEHETALLPFSRAPPALT